MQLPEEDKYNYTREYMEASITILLAGRIAEEMFLDSMTTGASNDLERVTELARRMVCEWGMSPELGPLTFGKREEQIFLGREISRHQDYSESTAIKIDDEVKRIVVNGYDRAKSILEQNRDRLKRLAEALLEYESLEFEEIDQLMKGAGNPTGGRLLGRDSRPGIKDGRGSFVRRVHPAPGEAQRASGDCLVEWSTPGPVRAASGADPRG